MSFFNILNSFFRKDKNEIYLPNYFLNIPNEVLKFMYLKNGPKKNIDTYTDEPSAIDIKLPISENLHNLEKLSYYPSYETLKPNQRFYFLNWLVKRNRPKDIGYAFLYLYSLERRLYDGEYVKEVLLEINSLQKVIDNESFIHYSSTSIIYAISKYKLYSFFDTLDTSMFPDFFVLTKKIVYDGKLTASEIIDFSRVLGYKEKRYIDNYYDVFKAELLQVLEEKYHSSEFIFSGINNKIPSMNLMLANFSLPARDVHFPDIVNSDIGTELCSLLYLAHDRTKKRLRKNNSYRRINKTTKKEINVRTGYPVATQNSINNTKQALTDSTKNNTFDKNKALSIARSSVNKNGALNMLERYRFFLYDETFLKGELAYKYGDWDEAEKLWLTLVELSPTQVCEKLSIMYRKQKRYSDEVYILQNGIDLWKDSIFNVYNGSTEDLEVRLKKASTFYTKHTASDKSTGITIPNTKYDYQFVTTLISLATSYDE
ncbi:TerB N-terminal domain-containing protein [Ligilactobacillus agilis]|uniref:TerB N-terminal domain-containing protein n=1 Tax=Ligilactobacillus agilis TaxID=1601 RepID=A0A9Q9JAZ8_9LACO|nr:TerB N-terminal domain-containing protein [Ligilactobacillus agilis]UXC64326.1 TerB N-terminal domain-containing protein [Ligilactobacillus agilis]UXC66328.1 TerB N-terminal domain-containing protein [Ligilactobacillus agilis]